MNQNWHDDYLLIHHQAGTAGCFTAGKSVIAQTKANLIWLRVKHIRENNMGLSVPKTMKDK
jgi:hypothetical protein